MSDFALRLIERLHGHIGWLAVAAVLHPALLLRNPKRNAALSVGLATCLISIAGAIGAYVYPLYRMKLKQDIFIHSQTIGWMFERKEHLAVGAIGFAWVGCVAYFSKAHFDQASRPALARAAWLAFATSFAMSASVALIGTIVASYRSF